MTRPTENVKTELSASITKAINVKPLDDYLTNDVSARTAAFYASARSTAIALPANVQADRSMWPKVAVELVATMKTTISDHGRNESTFRNNIGSAKGALIAFLIDLEDNKEIPETGDLTRTGERGVKRARASVKLKTKAKHITGFRAPAKSTTKPASKPNPTKLGQAKLDEIVATKAELMTEAIAHANELVSKGEIRPAPLKQALTALAIASREYHDAVVEGHAK